MKRLTTDTPDGNFETMLNFVYGKDGWAHIRHNGEYADVPLEVWVKAMCIERGCDEFSAETREEIDEEICDCMMDCQDCPVALAYCFASQAVHLRSRLKQYEDILFAEDGTELVSLGQLRTIISQLPNPPLTLEELREMDGEPVWCCDMDGKRGSWMLVDSDYCENCCEVAVYRDYGIEWLAYRRKPEEGTR